MSVESDLRAALAISDEARRSAETRSKQDNEELQRVYVSLHAAEQGEARALALEATLATLAKTDDPNSPMAVLAKVSEERDAVRTEKAAVELERDAKVSEVDTLQKQLTAALARITELEAQQADLSDEERKLVEAELAKEGEPA